MMILQVLVLCIFTLAASGYASIKGKEKPGVCPINGIFPTVCTSECTNDYDCLGQKKCCRVSSCATLCTLPDNGLVGGVSSVVGVVDTRSVVGGIDGSEIIDAGDLRRTGSIQGSSLFNKLEGEIFDGDVGGCVNECGLDKLCRSGYKCVETGCHRRCEVKAVVGVSSFDNVRAGSSRVFSSGSRRVGQSNLDVLSGGRTLDAASGTQVFGGRRSSVDVLEAVSGSSVIGSSTSGSRGGCIKECISDHDCLGNKVCIKRGCNMVCGMRSANGYSR